MYPKKCSILLFFILISSSLVAKPKENPDSFIFRGFSGGMMIHTGFLKSAQFTINNLDGSSLGQYQIKGAPLGLGGVARFHFGSEKNQIRIGGEGYTSTIKYLPSNSYEKIGWGGLLFDFIHYGRGRLYPFLGATIGGGRVRNHTFPSASTDDFTIEQYASYRQYPFFCAVPFIGLEIALTKSVRLTLKADYQIHLPHTKSDFAEGVRFYMGIIFNRKY